jgi:hypothetical protein
MKETSFHVTDFAGLYLVWPIIEFSMALMWTTKDKRMSSFTKCVTALLGKMLYINAKAMIAPISITDDDQASYISNKADLPTNCTKLGKHITISGSSWVFNKKEKGSNDVYVRFRLKLQIPTEDIINRVSFEFLHLGGISFIKSNIKLWKRRCHSCCSLFAMVPIQEAFYQTPSKCLI